jgi:hypothetical protein
VVLTHANKGEGVDYNRPGIGLWQLWVGQGLNVWHCPHMLTDVRACPQQALDYTMQQCAGRHCVLMQFVRSCAGSCLTVSGGYRDMP